MTRIREKEAGALRTRAETLLSRADSKAEDLTIEEVRALVHDLRVHQVELELQNEELQNIQRELQRVTNKYTRLYDNAPTGYLTVEKNGLIVQANKTFGDMVRVESHRLGRTSLFDLIHDDDRAEFISRFRAFYKNPQNKNIEVRIKISESLFFHAGLEGRIDQPPDYEKDMDSGHDQLLLIITDISTKKKAEIQVRNQKAILQTILDGIPDIITLLEMDHTIISINKAGLEYLGHPPDPTAGRKCYELLGRDIPCESCVSIKALQSGAPETIEEYISEFGRWYQVRAIPVFGNGRRPSMLVEQLHDIDDRKKMEIALIENEEKYRSLVENSLQGVVVAQKDPTRIKFASRPMFDITGYPPEELTRFSPRQLAGLIHPDDREEFLGNFKKRLSGLKVPPRREYRIEHKTRGIKWVEIFSSLIEYEGEPASQTAFVDITERKKAEAQHRKLELELRHAQKMEAIGTLAGGISHDFNNLLQAINGYTEIMLMDKKEGDLDYANLLGIMKSGSRAAQLVRQLLLFSREIETERRPIRIDREIEQAQKILERTIPKMIDIKVYHGSNLWLVRADPVQFEQVILNLGSNAADAMPEGGEIVIESQNVEIGREYAKELLGISPGRYVVISVTDTGCGMEKKVLEHIFEPFFTTKEVGKGTGLGLASVYGIVKSHGGFINCYSQVGQGAVFKIYLPAIDIKAGQANDVSIPNVPEGGTETILVVDDEKAVRDFTSQLLKRFGYSVILASSGEEAMELYTENLHKIDLVILDIGMPGMGGHRCLKELLKKDPFAVVLISSGYSVNGPIKETLKAGAAGFVSKPFQLNEILSSIRSVLNNKR